MCLNPLKEATIWEILWLSTPKEETQIMAKNQPIDLAAVLQAAFPPTLLESLARESRFVQRQRDFNPVTFFWAMMTCILSHSCTGIASVWREYEHLSETNFDRSSFYKHFSDEAAEFLRLLVNHACEVVFPQKEVSTYLRDFTAVLLQDSTILKLRKVLAERWPGAGLPAAAKLNIILCANGGTASKIQIANGTKNEAKFTSINAGLKGALLIFDMGYQSLKNFARIEHRGGYFLTRLKESFHPTIARSNVSCRGHAIAIEGQKVWDVVDSLKRAVLDVTIEVVVSRKGQPGPIPFDGHQREIREWRVVGLRNDETGEYHLYLTNIPVEWLTAEQIGLAYSFRWEVERLFAEFKGPYDLGSWAVEKEASMLCHVYGDLLAWASSRRLRSEVIGIKAGMSLLDEHLAAPMGRWARALQTHIRDVARSVVMKRRAAPHIAPLLRTAARDPNRGRVPLVARTHRIPRNARVTPHSS